MRFVIPGFHRGVVNPAWANKTATEEQGLGVSLANNAFLDTDGSLSRRFGTTYWQEIPEAPTSVATRLFPYRAGEKEFVIVMNFDPDVADANNNVQVFQLTGGAWSTTPVNWRPNAFDVGTFVFTPYISNNWVASLTVEGHPYTLADMYDVQAVQFEDSLFFLHPNYPTLRLAHTENGIWVYDPYYMERHPPEVDGSRSGITWSAVQSGASINWDFTTNKALFDRQAVPGVRSFAGLTPGATAFDGVNSIRLGSIYRFGDVNVTTTATAEAVPSYGAFFVLRELTSPTQARLTPIMHQNGAGVGGETYTVGAGGVHLHTRRSFAGPWNFVGTITGTNKAAVFEHNTTTNISVVPAWTADLTGCILVSTSLQTAFLVRDVNTGNSSANVVNLGKDITPGALTGTMQVFRPEFPHFIMTDNNPPGYNIGGTDAFFVGGEKFTKPLPLGHDTNFLDVGWVRKGGGKTGTDQHVGGAIFAGNGIVRADALTEYYSLNGYHIQKCVVWQQLLAESIGPFRDYGWGPSKGVGFASCGAPFQQRMFFAGFKGAPAAVIATATNRINSLNALLEVGAADAPLNLALAFQEGDLPKWMAAGDSLLIGCDSGEYNLSGSPISTASLGFAKVGEQGSSRVQPVQIGPEVYWVAANGRDVYKSVFEERHNAILTDSILRQFDSILEAGETIRQMELIGAPDRRLYCYTSEERLLVYSVSPEFGTRGWTTVEVAPFPDVLGSIAKVRSADNSGWDLWMATTRVFNLNPREVIEIMRYDAPTFMDIQAAGTGITTTQATFANHQGRVLGLIIDGKWGGTYTANASGVVDYSALNLSVTPLSVIGGEVYEVSVTAHFPALTLEAGPSAGAKLNLGLPVLFLQNSIGGRVQGKELQTVTVNQVPVPQTAWVSVAGTGLGPRNRFPQVAITQAHPWAWKLCAIAFDGGGET